MSALEWIAKRNLRSTSTVGIVYTADIDMQQIKSNLKAFGKESIALDGSSEMVGHRIEDTWMVKTTPLNDIGDGEFDQVKEMISSIMYGEPMFFDAYGTVATADNEQEVKLVQGSYSVERVSNISQTTAGTWVVSFSLRVI